MIPLAGGQQGYDSVKNYQGCRSEVLQGLRSATANYDLFSIVLCAMMIATRLFVCFLLLLFACGGEYVPRTGDLLFQQNASEGMTGAIVAATQRGEPVTFTHVGIVEAAADGVFVVEAIDTSVRRTPLGEFIARSAQREGRPLVAAGRLRGADSVVVNRALRRAHERLGLPYDDDFLPANGKLYCSELAWECFLAADDSTHLLQSRPMTFRTPDGELPTYWAEHFAALGMPVPEGVAGTNPNDMANDPAVEIVWRYYE